MLKRLVLLAVMPLFVLACGKSDDRAAQSPAPSATTGTPPEVPPAAAERSATEPPAGAGTSRATPSGDAAAGARPRAGAPRPGSAGVPAAGAAGASAASGNVHVVARGDTLQKIARARQVSVGDLMKWNNIQDPRRLQVGQELRLAPPGG